MMVMTTMMMMRVGEHLRWLEIWSCRRTLSQTVTDEKTPQTCHAILIFYDKDDDDDDDKRDPDKNKGKCKDNIKGKLKHEDEDEDDD